MTIERSFMAYESVYALTRSMKRDELNWLNYTDERAFPALACVPREELLANLSNMLQDERTDKITMESRRSPHMRGFSVAELTNSYMRLVSQFPDQLKVWERKYASEWGPPLDTTYSEYYRTRFLPHYDNTTKRVTDVYIRELFEELAEDLIPALGRLEYSPPVETWHRRNTSSSLGPNFMKALRDYSLSDQWRILYKIDANYTSYLRDPSRIITLAKPGTRISHAAIGSDPEDYNRIILMVDAQSYSLAAGYVYPFMDSMRLNYAPYQGVYGSRGIRRFVQEHNDHFYISADTSRMDHHVKWEPFGKEFAGLLLRLFPKRFHHLIYQTVDSIHHPFVYSPESAMYGPIGNASGSTDTTIKNCIMSEILLRHFEKKYNLPKDRCKRNVVGDDAAEFIPNKYRGRLPDDIPTAIDEAWSDLGFRAKKEKQEVGDYVLFLKTYFSLDPMVGKASMMGANVIRKMLHERDASVGNLLGILDTSEDENNAAYRIVRILDADEKYRIHRKNFGDRLPAKEATWPYYVSSLEAYNYLYTWFGHYGPILEDDVAAMRATLHDYRHMTPDRLRGLAVSQSLAQLRFHPYYHEIVQWVATHLDSSSVLISEDFLDDMAENASFNISSNPQAFQPPLMLLRTLVSIYHLRYPLKDISRYCSILLRAQYMTLMTDALPPDEYDDSLNKLLASLGAEIEAKPYHRSREVLSGDMRDQQKLRYRLHQFYS